MLWYNRAIKNQNVEILFNWWLLLHNKYDVSRSFLTLVLFKNDYRSNPFKFCWLEQWKRVLNLLYDWNKQWS